MSTEAMKPTENPVCTSDYDLPTPPGGNDWGDPGEPHPDEPGVDEYCFEDEVGPEPEADTTSAAAERA